MGNQPSRKYFFGTRKADAAMEAQNKPVWELIRRRIEKDCAEGNISKNVDLLDFGSHLGGFIEEMKQNFTGNLVSAVGVEPMKSIRDKAFQRTRSTFYKNKSDVPDYSATVVVSQESLYFEEDFYRWLRWLQRVLKRGENMSAVYIVLGSHGENTAWLRWRERLQKEFGHQSYVHMPMEMFEIAQREGFHVEHQSLRPFSNDRWRYTPPENGCFDFKSLEEEFLFRYVWKQLIVLYPR